MSTTIAARGSSPRMRVATVAMVFAFVATSFSVVLPHAVRAADASLVGYWTMNEASGTTAADTGALPANPLTTVGSPTFVPGKIGNALALSGSQNATTPDEASLDLTTAITMAAWIKPGALRHPRPDREGDQHRLQWVSTLPLLRQAVARARRLSNFNNNAATRSRLDHLVSHRRNHVGPCRRAHDDGTTIRIYYNGDPRRTPLLAQARSSPTPRLRHRRPEQQPRRFTGAMDDVRIYNRALSSTEVQQLAANTAPVPNAGSDQTITLPATAALSGTASDDGLPNPPAALTTTWSKVSGPGTVTFGNANALTTTSTFSVDGTYVLRLTADDGVLSATDDMTVTVQPSGPVNHPPTASSGNLATTANSPVGGTLVATDTDIGDTLTYSIVTNGTHGTAAITNALTGAFTYTPNADAAGVDTFTFKANDGTVDSNVATVTVTITGLVGHWQANEGSGPTLIDSAPLPNDGALQGNPTWVPGQLGQAVRFDGTGDYAVVPDNASLDISGNITIAAWVRPEKPPPPSTSSRRPCRGRPTAMSCPCHPRARSSSGSISSQAPTPTASTRQPPIPVMERPGSTWRPRMTAPRCGSM